MEFLNLENESKIKPIEVKITLSCGAEWWMLWGFSCETVLGYEIDGTLSLEKDESYLKEVMRQSIMKEFKKLPQLIENLDSFIEQLHYHGDLNKQLELASKINDETKFEIYLCIH